MLSAYAAQATICPPIYSLLYSACRIELERTEIWPLNQETAIRGSSGARATHAMVLLRTAACAAGVEVVAAGIVAGPGLLDDLGRVRTAHDLWHYRTPNRDDPTTGQLVPGDRQRPA